MTEATDWDDYYQKRGSIAKIARAITKRKLVKTLMPYLDPQLSICEMGGANSCVMETLCSSFNVANYHIADSNQYGLSLLPASSAQTPVSSQLRNILIDNDSKLEQFDLVFSIGLIEHFDNDDTFLAIKSHIDACKPNGIILITFPTPTLPYKLIRKSAEIGNIWRFPDERPLKFDEVLAGLSGNCDVLHQSINWLIGLTQGYVVARKRGAAQ